ncbi:hypothetical protein LEP1GSC161_1364 [Leptospira santarosai str. CBC1416]|uniref:Uncharacterized protein n=2 Tax=Leptospira santarosai TaxID=28183 RepID=M6UY01_9LEPT|nr:HEPN domain-containing protein [Leptospira santarosai]EKR93702.1 hypothetical protein LEP1GSC163_4049 [Leptospira santarosai str. CBC379]EMO45899.1 hypothetical protein LEP1GSC187_3556 [Leptospira santarosai str. ZUN179]EMO58409.1 hypothetical protein LEP1GSC161_1364 [Leptospira santarosai str. CBC1416]
MKEKVIKGYWWLPDSEKEKIPGILTINSSAGISLDLMGAFEKNLVGSPLGAKYNVISGFSTKGKKYTLLNSHIKNRSLSFPGILETQLMCAYAFEGFIFKVEEEILFSSLRVEYSNLNEWVALHGFEIGINLEENKSTIEYQLPSQVKVNLADGFTLKINFLASGPGNKVTQKEAIIKQNVELIFSSSVEKSLSEFEEIIYKIANFLSLAMNEPVYILSVSGNSEKSKIRLKDKDYYEPILIESSLASVQSFQEADPYSMPFTYEHITDKFQEIISKWLENYSLLESTYNLYFETVYNNGLNVENRFLNLTQAIESYHRKKFGGSYVSKEEYLEKIYPNFIEQIPSSLDKGFKESLKNKFKYGYEFSLRKRLKDLFEENGGILKEFIKKDASFITQVTESRNYYTHYDEKNPNVKFGVELYILSDYIMLSLIVLFLSDLSFEKYEIIDMLDRNNRLQTILSRQND